MVSVASSRASPSGQLHLRHREPDNLIEGRGSHPQNDLGHRNVCGVKRLNAQVHDRHWRIWGLLKTGDVVSVIESVIE